MSTCKYQIRRWDSFNNTYNMIPIDCTTLTRAFDLAVELQKELLDNGDWCIDEIQIWENKGDSYIMLGYIEYNWGDDDDPLFSDGVVVCKESYSAVEFELVEVF